MACWSVPESPRIARSCTRPTSSGRHRARRQAASEEDVRYSKRNGPATTFGSRITHDERALPRGARCASAAEHSRRAT